MKQHNNLLIVAGAGRNVGKTEFVCRLIHKVCRRQDIYGLKVSALHPDEAIYHGDHSNQQLNTNLFEETRHDLDKDTSRMLRAGARKVFYLQGDDEQIRTGFHQFQNRIAPSVPIICESTSLWKYIRPGLLVLVKTASLEIKPRAAEIIEHACLVIDSDGCSGFAEIDLIAWSELHGWHLHANITS